MDTQAMHKSSNEDGRMTGLLSGAKTSDDAEPAVIETFTVSDDDAKFDSLRSIVTGSRRSVPAGIYRRLCIGGQLMMSDTPDELSDLGWFRSAVSRRGGGIGQRVLITGLGLGCAVKMAILAGASEVDVIEKNSNVIALVRSHLENLATLNGCVLRIHCADALTGMYRPGVRWNVIWHDIWPTICADNLTEITALKRKFGGRCDCQGVWCEREMRRQAAHSKRMTKW